MALFSNKFIRWVAESKPETIERLAHFIATYAPMREYAHRDIQRLFRNQLAPIRKDLPWMFQPLFLAAPLSSRLLYHMLYFGMNTAMRQFVAGNGPDEIWKVVEKHLNAGYRVNVDILGEVVRSEDQAKFYEESYCKLIDFLGPRMPQGSLNLSGKFSQFYSQSDACAPEYSAEMICKRMFKIMERLAKFDGRFYGDAEYYWMHEIHFLTIKNIYQRFGNSIYPVLQSYLREAQKILEWFISISKLNDPLRTRLVRGATVKHEWMQAELNGWQAPSAFTDKQDTDSNYDCLFYEGMFSGLDMIPATHNIHSIINTHKISKELNRPILENQILFGPLGEEIGKALLRAGKNVCVYLPVLYPKKNDFSEAVPYDVRRIDETLGSFITQHIRDDFEDMKELLVEELSK